MGLKSGAMFRTVVEVGQRLEVSTRTAWRSWLRRNHASAREIWLVFHKKSSGRPRVSYNDAVDEALCFGWIDSTVKGIDEERFAQRFTPRRPGSVWSAMNQARVRRLEREGRMTAAGRRALATAKRAHAGELRADVKRALQKDPEVWRNFRRFPKAYRDIRIGWVEAARKRPAELRKRMAYFVKMTKANKMYGMVRG